MQEVLQALSSIGGILSLALFLVPGSLFYAIMQNYAFRSGRYNLSPPTKLFIVSFISLLLLILTIHLQTIPLLKSLYILCSNFFSDIGSSELQRLNFTKDSEASVHTQNITMLVEGVVVSILCASTLNLCFHFFRLIRERNFIDKHIHYPLIRFTGIYSRKLRYLTKKKGCHLPHKRVIPRLRCKLGAAGLKILINCIAVFLLLVFIALIFLYVIDLLFYTVGQLLNHPLHRSIHRWKKWKQLPIIEVRMKNGILYKGVLHCFEPKNRSEIDSISLRNVISYIPKKDTLSLSPNNREEVYNFGHRQEFFTIPFSQIDNFNIWHFAGNASQYNTWSNLPSKNDIHIALWYLRLELTNYWYKADPEMAIKLPSNFDANNESILTDLILDIARTVDQSIPKAGSSSIRMRRIWLRHIEKEISKNNLPFPTELRQICHSLLILRV